MKIDTSSDILGMVSTCFIPVMLELEHGCRGVNWKVYKDCAGSEVMHLDWYKCDTKGVVVTHCGHVLVEVLTSKYQQHGLQVSGMFEVGYMLQLHFSFLKSDRSKNMLEINYKLDGYYGLFHGGKPIR